MKVMVALSVVMILVGLVLLGYGMATSEQIRRAAAQGRVHPLQRATDRGGRLALLGWVLALAGLALGVVGLYVL